MTVAPQIKGFSTDAEFKKFMFDAANGGRHEANEFMRRGDSKWVARALAEGWGRVLRDIVAELCRRHMIRNGQFPMPEHLKHLTISKEDHESFKRVGGRA